MRQNNRDNPRAHKELARSKYRERQINKYTKWAIESRGYLKWNELIELQNKYNLKVYG